MPVQELRECTECGSTLDPLFDDWDEHICQKCVLRICESEHYR